MNKINLFRIAFISVFIVLFCYTAFHIKPVETNILRAILTHSEHDDLLVSLSGKYASRINVTFESDDADLIEETKDSFLKEIDKSKFEMNDYSWILDEYKKYPNNFLTYNSAKLLQDKKYEILERQSMERLYSPLGISLLPVNEDPFVLFSEYILSLKSSGYGEAELIEFNDKYYEYATLDFKKDISGKTDLLNAEMSKIVKLQKKLSNDEIKIYVTGAPIHSYYASSKSIFDINLICAVSTIFIMSICYYYFRSVKILVPIMVSILFGILCGYCVTSLLFPAIHILTFVFSTTLIGISIDYSLHFFVEKDLKKILKALTVSLFTTAGAFLALLFANIGLLKQITVFTAFGLIGAYLLVVLFFPLLNSGMNYPERSIMPQFNFSKKTKVIVTACFLLICIFGVTKVKFSDDIREMYVPSKKLLQAEKLFKDISGQPTNVSFLTVTSSDFQLLMQKEEEIAQKLSEHNFQYLSLSRFIPSINMQQQNQKLVKELYNTKLTSYATFLTPKEKDNLIKSDEKILTYNKEKYPCFEDFMINKNTSLMVLYDVQSPEIFAGIKDVKYFNPVKDISVEMKKCRQNCMKLILPLFIALLAILAIIYKPKNAVKIAIPSILGMMFSFAVLGFMHQPLNIFHILSAFLIVGFSLNYAVFRSSGIQKSRDAVLISCITSVLSFFLLSLTSFKLISSLGFVVFVGLTVSYLFSLLLIADK